MTAADLAPVVDRLDRIAELLEQQFMIGKIRGRSPVPQKHTVHIGIRPELPDLTAALRGARTGLESATEALESVAETLRLAVQRIQFPLSIAESVSGDLNDEAAATG